jgi:hypothetical protein
MSAAASMRLTQLPREPESTLAAPAHARDGTEVPVFLWPGCMGLHEYTGLPGIAMPASGSRVPLVRIYCLRCWPGRYSCPAAGTRG